MIIRSALCCALLLAVATSTWGADKAAPKKHSKAAPKTVTKIVTRRTSAKPMKAVFAKAAKPAPKTLHKTSLKRDAAPATHRLHGKTEILACRDGTEDRHARIAVVLVGGKTDSFAYYSKWKPRTCSIYVKRTHDPYSKWTDKGNLTSINLEHGTFLIDHGKGTYRFTFKDVDRERYCGMDGAINGTLTVRKGSERCEVAGIMEEGTPLGQAYAKAPDEPAPAAAPAAAEAPKAPDRVAQRPRREASSPFPSPTVGISD